MDGIRVLAFDIFGTTVDWYTGVGDQVAALAAERGVTVDGGEFALAWRDQYLPSMDLVRRGNCPGLCWTCCTGARWTIC